MNGIKYVVALFALFMLMIPAFSQPDDDHNSMMGDGHHHGFIKSMMGDGSLTIVKLTACDITKVDEGQFSVTCKSIAKIKNPKSMMGGKHKFCGSQKSMMGQWGKDKSCGCEKSMMGDKCKYSKDKSCGCEKSMMGEKGHHHNSHHHHHSSDDSESE